MITSRVQLIFTSNGPAASPEKLLSYSKGAYKLINRTVHPVKQATYTPRDPRRGALAILKQAKMATASVTALRYVSALVPMRFDSKSLFIASRGTRLNVVAIADHPATAGTTNVSAIPKQYSNGRPELDDRANVRDRAETEGKFTHDFGHFANSRGFVEYDNSRAEPKDYEQKQSTVSNSTPIGEDENDTEPYVEWDINAHKVAGEEPPGSGD
ncbi:uncharacterized protein BP5553_01721 [Venustampulla echinocandica]|uniref:Uncharacterized protein n=1 Tax=Venustampulla echinocandica TaxID=2656787 RepID=A0A370U1T6_9HELO|nr:uncharacterized protein BP5553_01721 [Venustampulla echinocandica]RDL41742.1 hypothetical protein BP5553_01721 [Venustampulla echinocandica]